MTGSPPPTPWKLVAADESLVDALARSAGLSRTTARVLVSRGVTTAREVSRFFEPDLARDWLGPDVIPGMPEAADAVVEALRAGRHVVVFGDFDLDGISSAAVTARGLEALGGRVTAVVPHRFKEGYGLSSAAIERLMPLEPGLVVTVDCGISAGAEVKLLRSLGVDVVVTDHHEPGDGLPEGIPVADPKLDASCPCADLAGAGVALKLVQAVGERLGKPDAWRELTDLATLGTVADIVPLTAENRALVADGVSRMRLQPRLAIAALAAVTGIAPDALTSESVAFSLAPRLNAAGRIADPQVALDLLLTDDAVAAESLARALDELNRTRQAAEADLAEAALAMAERVYAGERALVLAGEGWHEGVKGIVASRLASRFEVPTLLFAIEDGVALGSGRSAGSVDLFQALEACDAVLTRFGGHAAAVGCALPADSLDEFKRLLLAHLDTLPAEQFVVEQTVDAEVDLGEVSLELGAEIAQLEPFGHANRPPVLVAPGVFMNGRQRVGKIGTHMKFTAYDGAVSVPAIMFRCPDIDGMLAQDAAVDLAFEIAVDEWRGRRRVQMRVKQCFARPAPELGAPAYELVEDLFARADEILAREEYASIEEAPAFHTKLAGVTFEGRQEVLERVSAGTPLRLVRQPDNPYDPNACALFDPRGDQVGFFNRRLAATLAPSIDAGVEYDVEVTEVTGGEGDRSLGVNVLVSRRDAVVADEELAASRAARRAELAAIDPAQLDAELTRGFIGERSLHPAQVQALAHLGAGRSVLTVMATGRGKSLIFHLHAARIALRERRSSVFVYPLRALVADQAFHLTEAFSGVGLTVRTVTGESGLAERDDAFAALADGDLDVVLTTPEFFHLYADRFAAAGRVGFVVIDEAHHVGLSRAGHRPAYARLGEALEALGRPTVLAVTATADDAAADAIRAVLGTRETVLDPTVRENLQIVDKRDAAEKDGYVTALAGSGEKTVVYVNSRDQSVKLARMLRKRVPEVAMRTAFYNGGMTRQMRHAVERAFRSGEISVVVSTSAFGEGVNIPDVRNVVLYHLPFNSVEFNQMSGRAGRDGALARIHLLFGGRDARINETILSSLAPHRDDMAALYLVLRDIAAEQGAGFEITNAELAAKCRARRKQFGLDERGISSALGIFKDLGFVTGEGHGVYRRLTFSPGGSKVDLTESLRYAEGMDEIAEFQEFRAWVLSAEPAELLGRFNRPILPSS
jgi:single-stranded-DNA-specific exonuclease